MSHFIDVKLVYNTCIIIARNNVREDSVVIADTDRRVLRYILELQGFWKRKQSSIGVDLC